jgi:hypothetical protein
LEAGVVYADRIFRNFEQKISTVFAGRSTQVNWL